MKEFERFQRRRYSKYSLEEYSEYVNRFFFPERLEKVIPLDAHLLVELLGFDIDYRRISPRDEISALTVFSEGSWPIWDVSESEDAGDPKYVYVPKKTVLINDILGDENGNRAVERFTVAHEACHILKDEQYFLEHPILPAAMIGRDLKSEDYIVEGKPTLRLVERQANYMAASMLMPRKPSIALFKELVGSKPSDFQFSDAAWLGLVVDRFAELYGVSFSAAKYRLEGLDVLTVDI